MTSAFLYGLWIGTVFGVSAGAFLSAGLVVLALWGVKAGGRLITDWLVKALP